ncbi:MAG: hypothetical protein ACO3LE_04635 [Bdellovibrionota bacterium]
MLKPIFSLFLLSVIIWLIQPSNLTAGFNGPGEGLTEFECEDSQDQSGPFQVYTGAESSCVPDEKDFKKDVLKASGCDANNNGQIDESEVQCVFNYLKRVIKPKDPINGTTKDEVWKWLEPFLEKRKYWWPSKYLDGVMKYDCDKNGRLTEEEVKNMLRGKKCGDN